jgi:hypothetical protein
VTIAAASVTVGVTVGGVTLCIITMGTTKFALLLLTASSKAFKKEEK